MENGTRVQVYRNLNKPGYFSVRVKTPKGWRLAGHVESIALRNCKFTVQESGRQRTITKQREVHAWVEGDVAEGLQASGAYVRYNPWACGSFTLDGQPVTTAPAVVMTDCKTFLAVIE